MLVSSKQLSIFSLIDPVYSLLALVYLFNRNSIDAYGYIGAVRTDRATFAADVRIH